MYIFYASTIKKYHTDGTVLTSNQNIVESSKIITQNPNTGT